MTIVRDITQTLGLSSLRRVYYHTGAVQNFSATASLTGGRLYSTSTTIVGWKSRIDNHLDATTARVCEDKRVIIHKPLTLQVEYSKEFPGPGGVAVDSVVSTVPVNQRFSFSSLTAQTSEVPLARARFFAKVYNAQEKFEGATNLLELRSSIDGVKRLLDDIYQLLTGLKRDVLRGKAGTAVGRARAAAALWLQYQFNLRPLVSEIDSLSSTLNRLSAPLSVRVRAQASAAPSLAGSSGTCSLGLSLPSGVTCRVSYQAIVEKSTKISGAMVLSPLTRVQAFGFDASSWVIAAWEAIPFSFLVDYVLPLGQYIEAVAGRAVSLQFVSATTRYAASGKITATAACTAGARFSFTPLEATVIQKRVERRVGVEAGSLLPSFYVSPSPTRLLNAISLLFLYRSNKDTTMRFQR